MVIVYLLKGPSSASMIWSDNFKLNPNSFNKYRPKIISHLPLTELSTWIFHVMTFVALSAGKLKSTLTLRLVVILPDCVGHYIIPSVSECSFSTSLPITFMELHPLSNSIRKLLNFALPLLVFIHPCRIGE